MPAFSDPREPVSSSAWLFSISRDLGNEQRHASLIGIDVQNAHYPTTANLPENRTLGLLDALDEDLPAEHVGLYDVIHIRTFSWVFKKYDPEAVLRNAYKMLKLDGSLKAVAPVSNPQSSTVSTVVVGDMVATSLQSQSAGLNLKFPWLHRPGSLFEEQGFEIVDDKRMNIKKELRSVMTVSLLMIHEHILRIAVRNGCMVGTNKNWEEVWTKAGEDIANGVSLTMDMIVVVGRKRP
jgi:hypothetical protein